MVFMTFSAATTQVITVHLRSNNSPVTTDFGSIPRIQDAGLDRHVYGAWLDVVRYYLYENMDMDSMDMKPIVQLPFGDEWVLDPLRIDEDHMIIRDTQLEMFNDRAMVFTAYSLSSLTAECETDVEGRDPLFYPLFFVFYDRCRDRIVLRLRDTQPPGTRSFRPKGLMLPVTSDLFYHLVIGRHYLGGKFLVDSSRPAKCMDLRGPPSSLPDINLRFYHYPVIYGDSDFILVFSISGLDV